MNRLSKSDKELIKEVQRALLNLNSSNPKVDEALKGLNEVLLEDLQGRL